MVKYKYNKTLYDFYKENKICVQCGQDNAAKDRVRCPYCLYKNAESSRKTMSKETKEEKEIRLKKNREYKRKRRIELKEKGLCIICQKPICSWSKVLCIDCAVKNKRKNEKRKHGISRNQRSSYGKCYICNKPVRECGSMCDRCYEMVCNNLPKKTNEKLYVMRKNQNKALFRN